MNKCLVMIQGEDGKSKSEFKEFDIPDKDLSDLEVKVLYSAINYKDALAVTGKAPIIRSFPLIPGIDICGEVLTSDNADFSPGDKIIATGFGLGEKHNGGYTTQLWMNSKYAIPLAKNLEPATAMALGTAGFTAMLCVSAIMENNISPDAGAVVVSGASGGVGGVAVKLLTSRGYEVVAVTSEAGKPLVTALGASKCLMRSEMEVECKMLEEQKWAGAVDTVGGNILQRILAETKYGGVVVACGLAGSPSISTSVMPFIIRAVRLIGIDSVYYPAVHREHIWEQLARDFGTDKPKDGVSDWLTEISLDEVPDYCNKLLQGVVKGRIVVNLQK